MAQKYLICTLLPAACIILWAIFAKLRSKDWKTTLFTLVAGFTLIVNGYAVYHMILDNDVPQWMLLAQLILSPTIVPQAYAYFCRLMGTRGSIGVTVAIWALLLFLLVPSLCIDIHPFREPTMCEAQRFMHFNIFNHGVLIYSISIPSLIILLQAIITIARIPVVTRALHVYDLKFSANGKFFVIWWMLSIIFCIGSSLIEMEQLRRPVASWIYFVSYAILIAFVFGQIASGLDLRPIQSSDDEEEDVHDLDAFIEANHELAQRAQRLFMEEKLYLRPGLVTDDVVRMLGTNRTYFTRMMRAEFNMSFNEFITSERIAYSKQLLTATDKPLEEIAEESGFGNASAYCRVFKRLTNVTPDAWRKDHQNS